MRVADNGGGIEAKYVRAAFLRHATSKISTLGDLENVRTLGFRGEALSSVASVAQVELITKTKDAESGSRLELEGGAVVSEGETGCSDGTVIIVRNLFFNTPARRKFMKKPAVESGYVTDVITRQILAHPEISFNYINNGSELIRSVGGDAKSAIFSVYGKDVASKLLPAAYKKNGFTLSGFVGKPELSRASRGYEQFFINGRCIKSELLSRAVEDAYRTRLLVGKFPVCVLYLTTAAGDVDVNVHPAKAEVRFNDEDFIYDFVKTAVEKSFAGETLIPSATLDEPKRGKAVFTETGPDEPAAAEDGDGDYALSEPIKGFEAALSENIALAYGLSEDETPPVVYINFDMAAQAIDNSGDKADEKPGENSDEKMNGKAAEDSETKPKEDKKSPFFNNYKIIGQAFSTYWIIEQSGSLYLIDQHAAHEKVLYERLTSGFLASEAVSQRLLSPIAVNLSERETRVVEENRELLEDMGFELEEFGGTSFAIRSVPFIMGECENMGFFTDLIDRLTAIPASVKNIYDTKINEIATMACKAAVKANDRLSYTEAKALIEALLKLENPFSCPHGRPTIIELTKYEIEKKFKRIQN
jgi:DNA mismatch repair protein MutL